MRLMPCVEFHPPHLVRILFIGCVLVCGVLGARSEPGTTESLTSRDIGVLTTTLHAFLHDHYPQLQPEQTTIVLPETERRTSNVRAALATDAETSPLLKHLNSRNMQPFDFTQSITASGIRFLGFTHAVRESKATRDGKRAYIQMSLPGYTGDGAEAVVHVVAAENDSTTFDWYSYLYYLKCTGTRWQVVSYRLLSES